MQSWPAIIRRLHIVPFTCVLLLSLTTQPKCSLGAQNLNTQSQSPSLNAAEQDIHSRRFLLTQLCDDFNYFLLRPDFLVVVGGIALAPTILKSHFQKEEPDFTEMWGASRFADDFFEFGEFYGESIYPMSASAALYALGRIYARPGMSSFASDLFRAHSVNGLLTISLKGVANRARPDGAAYSYPSGHTSSAFATAGVVYSHFGKYFGLPAFAIATYVGSSRLQENKHFFSDVVAGALLGSYVGIKIVRSPIETETLKLSPSMSGGAPGLKLTLKF